jgi:hypothetical protein
MSAEHSSIWNMISAEKPTSEVQLLEFLGKELATRLPGSWQVDLAPQPRYGRTRPDALLTINAPDGAIAQVLVEAKTTLNTRDVPAALSQLEAAAAAQPETTFGPPLLISRYIAPSSREMVAEAGASYMDATGNLRIVVDRPALFLKADGASADPWRGPERETRTLRGKPAACVTRALVDFKPPLGIRELSKLSGASLGSTYRTVDFLDKEALIQREKRGTIVAVNWADLLLRWSEDYSFQESNQVHAALEPRGPERVLERLRNATVEYAVTGALNARRVNQVASPRIAAVFTANPGQLSKELELHDGSSASNVLLARPFDEVAFARAEVIDGVRYAALSQTAVDLLTGPGRDPAEGEALIAWMRANEADWRG